MTFCDICASPTCIALSKFHALMRFKDRPRSTAISLSFLILFFFLSVSDPEHCKIIILISSEQSMRLVSCTLCDWIDSTAYEGYVTLRQQQSNFHYNIYSRSQFGMSYLLLISTNHEIKSLICDAFHMFFCLDCFL